MTSQERARAAIARQPVDRVPLGFYCCDHDTVSRVIGRPTYVRNRVATQLALWDGRRDEVAESLKLDTVEFYRKLDCADIILPKEAAILPPKDYDPDPPKPLGENRWETRGGRIIQAVPEVNDLQTVYTPPAPPPTYTVEQFETEPEVKEPDPSIFEAIDFVIQELGTERYVCSFTGGVTALSMLGGTEHGLMLYGLQPEVVEAYNRRAVKIQNQLDRWHIRPGCSGVLMEQDMAGSNGPYISPGMFREHCFPFLKERAAHVKQHVDQIVFHNCGRNIPLMEMFVECGFDCYQSLQTTAGMEVGYLKEHYGDHLAFWGGVSLELLVQGTPEQVRQEVRTAMERGAPGGGFILGPSHSIAFGTQYDNFMAMLDEFDQLRDKY